MDFPKKVVLFDFDGTLTSKDTLFVFTRQTVGIFRFLTGMVILFLPMALQKTGLLSAHKAKEFFLSFFFKNQRLSVFTESCDRFAKEVLPSIIRKGALEALRDYQNQSYRIIIVSASAENWIIPWANTMGIEVIASQLEIKEELLTGRLAGENCNGKEKVNRIRKLLNISEYEEIVAYGDSAGDQPMFELAHRHFYKPFRT
ncbi:MAG: HAD-IB family hydrolase [Cytophaga sp.]|nr:HAD-IB family hydrolase [Cytophaga sp.]